MRRLASCVAVLGLAVVGAGCGAAHARLAARRPSVDLARLNRPAKNPNRVSPGPFVPSGDWAGGGGSGMWGDGPDGPQETTLGCIDNRHYSYAFGLRNRAPRPVTLTAARGANPAGVVRLVAIQLRLSPPRPRIPPTHNPTFDTGPGLAYRGRWSAAPARPVTIPPHRVATVQVNYLMRNCVNRKPWEMQVPGRFAVRYRMAARSGVQHFGLPENRFVVVAGPVRRTCDPVPGSAQLRTSNFSCALAQRVAPRCRKMQNGGWLDCQLGGTLWECGRFAGPGSPLLETCYLPHEKTRWFSVVWAARGLGLWGAIQDRPSGVGWRVLDKSRTTGGRCTLRDRGRTLIYESAALVLGRGRAITEMPMVAHVRFLIHGYRGPGNYWASTGLRVAAPRASYGAIAGRIRIVRATKGSIAGMAFASLRRSLSHGPASASLNGTWSCGISG